MAVTTVITVDEFYDNPDEVRNYALSLKYPKPPATTTYPGRNSDGSFYPDWMDDKISNIVGEDLTLSEGQMNGGFRMSLAGDSYKQDIHVDPVSANLWAGVLYLSKPEHCVDEEGYPYPGTITWRHKTLGWERVPLNPEEGAKFGFETYTKLHDEVIEKDGIDRSKWVPTNTVYMKYNRLIIFRPWIWHSAGVPDGIGDNALNGRLSQIFFWRKK